MKKRKVGIVVECMCDLPKAYLTEHKIDVIYFLIETEKGVFTDTDEVTAKNILEYMASGGDMPRSTPPEPEVYEKVFLKNLGEYEEVLFISSGSGASASYGKAMEAYKNMGGAAERVCIFDSMQLSTGIGHIIMRAVELAEDGADLKEMLPQLEELRDLVSTSFITYNADYLYRGGHVSEKAKNICDLFNIHPVLTMKNGKLALKSVMFGRYDKTSMRYIRKELKNSDNINKKRIFITHTGCSMEKLEQIKSEVKINVTLNH